MATTYTFPTTTSPIDISETSDLQNHSTAHSRKLSTVSSVTLRADTSSHLTPYEPLLPPISTACDVISHQPRLSPIISLPCWSQNNLRHSSSRDEKPKNMYSKAYTPSKRFRWFKIGLETVMVLWSLYTMIRYLYAFTIYDSLNGQLAAFSLGVCAGLSFAFTSCSIILSTVNKHLLVRGVFVKSLSLVHSILQYPPSVCFLLPAIANFVLLLVWKNTSNFDLNFRHRCKVDVDLVWTIKPSRCDNLGQPWGVWITLAALRIVLSLLIVIAFHNVQSLQVIPMPNLSYIKTAMTPGSLSPKHISSKVSSKKFLSIPPLTRKDFGIHHRATESSLSIKASSQHQLRSAKSRSSDISEGTSYHNTDFLPIVNPAQNESTFIDRFRRLVSLITQETDDAVAYARSSVVSTSCNSQDSAESPTLHESCQGLDKEPHSPEYDHIPTYDDQDDDFYSSPPAEEDLDSNYPQPYPADEEIRMMNGYLMRMPTIESMGSRELVGSIGTGNTNHERNGPRPSTRNTMLSWNGTDVSGSDPRRRSLTAQAELLYGKSGASEVGELMKQGMSIKMVGSCGSSDAQGDNQEPLPDYYSSSTPGSKNSAQSFHTAQSRMDKSDNLKFSVAKDPNPPSHLDEK